MTLIDFNSHLLRLLRLFVLLTKYLELKPIWLLAWQFVQKLYQPSETVRGAIFLANLSVGCRALVLVELELVSSASVMTHVVTRTWTRTWWQPVCTMVSIAPCHLTNVTSTLLSDLKLTVFTEQWAWKYPVTKCKCFDSTFRTSDFTMVTWWLVPDRRKIHKLLLGGP